MYIKPRRFDIQHLQFSGHCLIIPLKMPEIEEWLTGLDLELPIRASDIPGFAYWLDWNGWGEDVEWVDDEHTGFDFAAYLNTKGKAVLGLPPHTPVRAIADGIVRMVNIWEEPFYREICIGHTSQPLGAESLYTHVAPSIEIGQHVKRGEIIGRLYSTDEDLIHLHLSLLNGHQVENCLETDPTKIFPELGKFRCLPQEALEFEVIGLNYQPRIVLTQRNITRY